MGRSRCPLSNPRFALVRPLTMRNLNHIGSSKTAQYRGWSCNVFYMDFTTKISCITPYGISTSAHNMDCNMRDSIKQNHAIAGRRPNGRRMALLPSPKDPSSMTCVISYIRRTTNFFWFTYHLLHGSLRQRIGRRRVPTVAQSVA